MLSDEQIAKIFREIFNLVDSRPIGKQLKFVRAIERESTAPLIEQIKEDEALMRDALEVLEDSHANHNAMCASTRSRLRQRLEAKT